MPPGVAKDAEGNDSGSTGDQTVVGRELPNDGLGPGWLPNDHALPPLPPPAPAVGIDEREGEK